MDGTGALFNPFLKKLPDSDKITVISYPPDEKLSYPQLVDFVADKLPQSEPIVILAESFSGPVALELAARGLKNLKGVVLCATFARSPHPLLLTILNMFPLSLFLRFSMPDMLLRRYCFGPDSPDSLIDLFKTTLAKVKSDVLSYRLTHIIHK